MTSLFLALAVSVVNAMPETSAAEQLPQIAFEKYTLPNGLEVILHEDHSTPIVGVNLWYHVGSKNEVPGRTGFAHLFEHMMFQGSQHYDKDYFLPLQQAGGKINGSTSLDRTNYWETVPSNYLELALWMERFYTENHRYDATWADPPVPVTSLTPANLRFAPREGDPKYYAIQLTHLSAQTFTIAAAPLAAGPQRRDPCGTLTLTVTGRMGVAGSASLPAEGCW